MEISGEIDSNERLSENDIKFWLLLLAFTTPFLISFVSRPEYVNIMLDAPVWSFGTMNDPIFRFLPFDVVILALPFGLIRLAFIQQVLLYKKNLTNSRRLVMIGILCELPDSILFNVFGGYGLGLPFPLFLVVGLLLAKYTTKEPLSWIEKESIAY